MRGVDAVRDVGQEIKNKNMEDLNMLRLTLEGQVSSLPPSSLPPSRPAGPPPSLKRPHPFLPPLCGPCLAHVLLPSPPSQASLPPLE